MFQQATLTTLSFDLYPPLYPFLPPFLLSFFNTFLSWHSPRLRCCTHSKETHSRVHSPTSQESTLTKPSRHTINCSLTGGVHLFLTRVMGLSEEDNRARSTAGLAPHNHSQYRETETVQREWSAECNKYGGGVMLVYCCSDQKQVEMLLTEVINNKTT